MKTNVTKLEIFLLEHPDVHVTWFTDLRDVLHVKMFQGERKLERRIPKELFKGAFLVEEQDIFLTVLAEMADILNQKEDYTV